MRVERGFLNWGVFLILTGLVPLAGERGYLAPATIDELWRLWPFILVGIGLGAIVGRTALGWVGGLIVATTFGLLAGAALAGGIGPATCALGYGTAGGGQTTTIGGDLQDGATVELDFDCGPLTVSTAPGAAWTLSYREKPGSAPRVDEAPDRLHIASPEGGFPGRNSNWAVSLPTGRTLSLEIKANASSADLALRDTPLSRVDGTFNAGSFRLDLSRTSLGGLGLRLNAGSGSLTLPASTFDGRIEINAGSLEVCVPADVGLRIDTGGALSSTDFAESGLILSGSTWRSPGYAGATTHIDLTITANAASVTLRRDGGCS